MSPAALRQQLEREAVERTLYEVENVYSPLRIACELVLLRQLHAACAHRDMSGMPDWRGIRRALDRIPAPDAVTAWDEIARAGVVANDPPTEPDPLPRHVRR